MSEMDWVERVLQKGFQQMGLQLVQEPFISYIRLLHQWNQAFNLTAVSKMETMAKRHVLDSLAILPWVHGTRVLDVGSGAGLPGIPLAIARPDLEVTLLDSNGKKTRFLQEVKRTLSLNRVEIIQSRVENYHPNCGFDTVVTRAFRDLKQMIDWTDHLVKPGCRWLAMKGRYPASELKCIDHAYEVFNYPVPGLDADRSCVIIRKE